jgi:DNA-binding CsgD family transcriptional regulator
VSVLEHRGCRCPPCAARVSSPARGIFIGRCRDGATPSVEGEAGIDTTRRPLATRVAELTTKPRRGILRRPAWWDARVGPLHSDDPRLRVLLAHLAALAAALGVTVLQRTPAATSSRMAIAFGIALGISALRTTTARRPLALTTICLDAIGTVLLVAGTGAPGSPFGWFALAGVWWAAHLRRPRSGLVYALVFTVAYAVLVVPEAIRQHEVASAFERIGALMVVAFLSDWFVRVDRRALELNEALHAPRFGPEHLAIRDGLQRALGHLDVSLDVVLAAGQLGLTAMQAELLSYLMLGLSNMEIADAMHLSEAAVRYRLTRLYRTLGVTGRGEAAERAWELGLTGAAEPISAALQT